MAQLKNKILRYGATSAVETGMVLTCFFPFTTNSSSSSRPDHRFIPKPLQVAIKTEKTLTFNLPEKDKQILIFSIISLSIILSVLTEIIFLFLIVGQKNFFFFYFYKGSRIILLDIKQNNASEFLFACCWCYFHMIIICIDCSVDMIHSLINTNRIFI